MRKNGEQIAALTAEHGRTIQRIQQEYAGQLDELQHKHDDLDAALKNLQATGRKTDKDEIAEKTRTLAGISAELLALREQQGRLEEEHRQALALLSGQLAEEKARLKTANTDKAAAEADSQTKAGELERLQGENAGISARLKAAEELASAKERELVAAKQAEEAAGLANRASSDRLQALETEAANLRTEAGKLAGTKAERDAAASRAAAAESAARQASEEARAAAAALEAAQGGLRLAQQGVTDANSRLAELESSTPKIRRITGNNNEEIGDGQGKRPPVMSEKLTVSWEKGAREALAWVFVLFGQGDNEVKNTILVTEGPNEQGEGSFEFISNIGGAVNAAIFDVIVHDAHIFGLQ